MEKHELYTWLDIEAVILQKKFAGQWPIDMIGASVYQDEIEIRLKTKDAQTEVSNALSGWFKTAYIKEEAKIYLEYPYNGKERFLDVVFEEDATGEQVMPTSLKPTFADFSLYPETPLLKGPDFSKLQPPPFVWAFFSFKGGVGRTLHLLSLVKALSEQDPTKRVLIVDADLEAPGLTWWVDEQLRTPEISFLDFLGLAHYDNSDDYTEALDLTAERVRQQVLNIETRTARVEHFFLPAFRNLQQLMRMPIRPENLCWEAGKEWIIPELLWKLGKKLGVQSVVVDLRAGLSEISSPILFDPRVYRVIVTTPSGQSLEGTKKVLEQIKKNSSAVQKNTPDDESLVPTVILSMIKEDLKDLPDIDAMKNELNEYLLTDNDKPEELMGKDTIKESLFDENLLYLKNLKITLEKLGGTNLHTLMSTIANEWFLPGLAPAIEKDKNYIIDLEKLKNVAKDYEFAESGKARDFLITRNLKTIARRFELNTPVAVIMGGKGSGKTYTYLQLAHLQQWGAFTGIVEGIPGKNNGFIWPLLAPKSLGDKAKEIIADGRRDITEKNKNAAPFKSLSSREIETQIDNQKDEGRADASSWRDFWFKLMAGSLSCADDRDPLEAMQKLLAENNTRVIFQIDGLEDYFQNIGVDEVEQAAVRALCQSVVNTLREWKENRIGLLVFIRKDLVKSAIKQNFGQFESLHQGFELKWDREEALRLAAWLVHHAAGLKKYIKLDLESSRVENLSTGAIENALEGLWGLKLGKQNSREAYTANWIISALSDFKGQLQARDLVRLIHYSAENASNLAASTTAPIFKDRLLPPSAIRNSLKPCSTKKIDEIKQEMVFIGKIFDKISKIGGEKKQIPFEREALGLSPDEIDTMSKVGFVTEYEGKYYMPEIIRQGLGFTLSSPGRLKVLNLLKQAQNQ